MNEQTTFTPQGIPIYSYPNPHLHSFCICLYMKGGPLYETTEQNGLSHFFEHIVFKNINRKMDGTLYQTLDKLGLYFNACTYRELIQFTLTGAPEHFREAADIFSHIFAPVQLPDQDISLECKRILAEIREENEKKTLDYFAQRRIWKDTSLAQSIPGKKKLLKTIGCEELLFTQQELLSVGNCFYYLTGNIREADIRYLEEQTAPYTVPVSGMRRNNTAPLPKHFKARKKKLHVKDSSISELCFAFDFDTSRHTEAERSLLYDLLFSGESCLIFQELSEKTGYIYSFDSHLEEYVNAGNLFLSFEIAPSQMLKAARKVTDVLCQLKRGEGICLDYVLPPYVDNSDMQLDDAESLNWTLAYERHFLGETWTNLSERSTHYSQVTPERIQALACDIFRPENLTLCYKGKKSEIPKALKTSVFSALS